MGESIIAAANISSILQDGAGNIYAGEYTSGVLNGGVWVWNVNNWTQLGGNIESASYFTSILRGSSGNIYAGGTTKGTAYGEVWVY